MRLGTNWPSITSHWMRSTPAASSAATSSPSRAKSAGSTDGSDLDRGGPSPVTVPCRAAAGDPYDALVELIPDRFAAGGEAIARDADGRVVFVNGALPGERVRVEITEHKRDWACARVVEIIDASPHRVRPPCPSRRAGCGGCGWQHMTHDAQRDAKRAVAADALTRIGGLPDADVRLGASVDPVGYRTTVRVAATADGRAGFRAEHTHDVVAAPDCLVAHPLLRRAIAALELAPEVEPTLRCSVATGEIGARWEGAGELVRGLPDGALVGGREALHETVAGTTLRVSMGSFFQSGPQAAELLVDTVRRAAPELSAAGSWSTPMPASGCSPPSPCRWTPT